MSTTAIPKALKQADITRFANRASQLKSFKPVISYWCNYHILEQILAKKFHTQDEECLQYTTSLMDELESFKAQNTQNDTVTDDVASQAYVEQFAYETFQRAENAMRADKATLQTADTLQAAATFFELLQIWGQLEPEISKKIKFAKYHALRIVKAVKAGEDPNLTNPKLEETSEESPLNSADPDVQAITQELPSDIAQINQTIKENMSGEESRGGDDGSAIGKLPNKEAGEGDEGKKDPSLPIRLPGVMDLDAPHAPLRKPSAGLIPDLPAAPSDFGSPASSRVESPKADTTVARDQDSKTVPHAGMASVVNPLNANTAEKLQETAKAPMTPPPTSLTPPNVPSSSSDKGLRPWVQSHDSHKSSPLAEPPIKPSSTPLSPDAAPVHPAVPVSSLPRPSISAVSGIPGPATSATAAPSTSPTHSPIPPPTLPSGPAETMNVDDHNISEAQKHARWAVSALQFDDVPTAIKELRIALGHLGTQ
ncbi:hypothetical protein KEM54_005516 [Ascosphaera aggregata]|nr:hypothetical protein KEM54_005516 [Ascosphaera aggregata]